MYLTQCFQINQSSGFLKQRSLLHIHAHYSISHVSLPAFHVTYSQTAPTFLLLWWEKVSYWSQGWTSSNTYIYNKTILLATYNNSLFQIFSVFWIFYAFFWVIPRRLNLICRRFVTLCLFHLHRQVGVEWLGLRNVGVFIREKVWLENSLRQAIFEPKHFPYEHPNISQT